MARNEWLKILSKLLLDSEMNVFLEHLLKGKRVKIITGLFICGPCVCYMGGPFYSETEESGLCPPLPGHLPPVHLDKSLGSSAQSQARNQPAFLPLPPSPHVSPASAVLDTLELGTVFLFLCSPRYCYCHALVYSIAAFVEGLGIKENDRRRADDSKPLGVCPCLRSSPAAVQLGLLCFEFLSCSLLFPVPALNYSPSSHHPRGLPSGNWPRFPASTLAGPPWD